MAENNSTKRKKASRWLIPVVIAVILGFVVVQLLLLDETREEQIADETEEITDQMNDDNAPTEDNAALRSVDEYIVFVSENNPDDQEIFVGDYIASAVDHLTEALEDLSAQEEISLNEATIEQIEEQSEKMEDADDQARAREVRNTFRMISQTMESLQLNDSERLQSEISALQQLADSINENEAIEMQNESISRFLEQAGVVLEVIENDV